MGLTLCHTVPYHSPKNSLIALQRIILTFFCKAFSRFTPRSYTHRERQGILYVQSFIQSSAPEARSQTLQKIIRNTKMHFEVRQRFVLVNTVLHAGEYLPYRVANPEVVQPSISVSPCNAHAARPTPLGCFTRKLESCSTGRVVYCTKSRMWTQKPGFRYQNTCGQRAFHGVSLPESGK